MLLRVQEKPLFIIFTTHNPLQIVWFCQKLVNLYCLKEDEIVNHQASNWQCPQSCDPNTDRFEEDQYHLIQKPTIRNTWRLAIKLQLQYYVPTCIKCSQFLIVPVHNSCFSVVEFLFPSIRGLPYRWQQDEAMWKLCNILVMKYLTSTSLKIRMG